MLETDVDAYLAGLSDRDAIATWARASVAALIKAGAIETTGSCRPTDEATRLDVAVLLGYVAAAVDHGIIKGDDNGTFLPDRAVKRVEMAVMMGRADRQIGRSREGEIRGIAEAVSQNSITIRNADGSLTFPLAAEAAVFVDHREAALDQVQFGMAVELKLNADLEVLFLEAESKEPLLTVVGGT